MAIRSWRKIDFSGGLQTATTRILRKGNEMAGIINGEFKTLIGGITRRLGYVQVGNTLRANKPALGAFVHRWNGGSRQYMASNNTDNTATLLSYLTGSSWTDLSQVIAPNVRMQAYSHLGEAYVVGADSTGVYMDPLNLDTSAGYSTTRNLYTAPRAKFIAEYSGQLYMINTQVNVPSLGGYQTYPDRAYRSSPPTGAITFVKADQDALATPSLNGTLRVDSVRYLKTGMSIDIYKARTDTLKYGGLYILSVDKLNNSITYLPIQRTFIGALVFPNTDTVDISDATNMPTGTPVQFTTTGGLPIGLSTATTYYIINPGLGAPANYGATWANDASTGTDDWVNPSNAGASDNTYTTWTGTTSFTSHYLKGTNFSFNIPTDATITGIQVDMEVKGTVGGGTDSNTAGIKLVKGGTIGGTDLNDGASFPTTDTVLSYGGTSQLWGRTWTPADINASNFGAVFKVASIAGTAYVDSMYIRVYYTHNGVVKFATSLANAQAGTAVDILSLGTGVQTMSVLTQVLNRDEVWGAGRKGKLSVYWNTDYPTTEDSDFLRIPQGHDDFAEFTGWAKTTGRLFMFTKNSMYKFDGANFTPVSTTIGSLSHEAIQVIGNWVIFPHYTGLYGYNDSTGQLQLLSRSVKSWFKAIPDANWTTASAGVIDNVYKLQVGTIGTYKGDPVPGTLRIVYDFDSNNFSTEFHTRQHLFQFLQVYNGRLMLHFADDTGKLYVDEVGNTDDGVTIPFEVEQGRENFTLDEQKNYYSAYVYTESPRGATVKYSVDGNAWEGLGELQSDVQFLRFPDGVKGNDINFKITQHDDGDPISVIMIVVNFNTEAQSYQ